MMAEGRLLRGAVLFSLALHMVVIAVLARHGAAHAIPLDDLRVVAVGTYAPPAPRPEISLPRELERRPPAEPVPAPATSPAVAALPSLSASLCAPSARGRRLPRRGRRTRPRLLRPHRG